MILDSRELAGLIWLLAAAVLALVYPKTRGAVVGAIEALFQPKLMLLWTMVLSYVTAVIWILALAGLWTTHLIGETIYWFLGPAIVFLSRLNRAGQDPRFLRAALRGVLELTIVLQFVINVYPLALPFELVLVPLLFFIVVPAAYAAYKPEHRSARVLLDVVAAILGLSLLSYALVKAGTQPGTFFTLANLREFVVPIIMTLAFVPFIYVAAVLMSYGRLFSILNWRLKDREKNRLAKRILGRVTLFRLRYAPRFQRFPWMLSDDDQPEVVRRVAEQLKSDL